MNRISVCLASFNGEKYIKEQLESIIHQLSEDDEIIISDDHSTDDTIKIVKSFEDNRIKIFKNSLGKGVVNNFQNSISKASHDIVFLCDQDDIWSADKIEEVMKIFENKETTLAISNAQYIDEKGNSLGSRFFNKPFSEDSLISHFVKPAFLGCAIAFRKNSVLKVFPIPKNVPMHDWWIGMLHMYYGKVKFINKDLIYYRRHDNNVTSLKRSSIIKIIYWRYVIFVKLVGRVLSKY